MKALHLLSVAVVVFPAVTGSLWASDSMAGDRPTQYTSPLKTQSYKPANGKALTPKEMNKLSAQVHGITYIQSTETDTIAQPKGPVTLNRVIILDNPPSTSVSRDFVNSTH